MRFVQFCNVSLDLDYRCGAPGAWHSHRRRVTLCRAQRFNEVICILIECKRSRIAIDERPDEDAKMPIESYEFHRIIECDFLGSPHTIGSRCRRRHHARRIEICAGRKWQTAN